MGPIPPFQLLSIGFTIATLLSLCIWKITNVSIISLLKTPAKYWAIGIFGIFFFNSFYISAMQYAPPAEVFLLTAVWPLIAIILDAVVLKERLRISHIVGCLLGLCGIVLIALSKGASNPDSAYIIGYIFSFLAAVVWASYSILLKRTPYPTGAFTGCISGACMVGMTLLHLLLETSIMITQEQWLPILLIGLGSLGVSYYCWNYGTQYGDLRTLSSLVFVGHFSAIGLLIAFGYTTLTLTLVIAFLCIIGGAFIGSIGLFLSPKTANYE
jgi:drug/metabolite transporter (DMT)-like permease